MHVTSADGTNVAVRRIGAVPPVVMLHGSGGGLHSWEEVGTRLAGEYTVWLLAQRRARRSQVVRRRRRRPAGGLARALPGVERVVWAGQMHFATRTAPDLVADTLRRFLREVAR